MTFERDFRYYKRFHCLHFKAQHMYEVNFNSRTKISSVVFDRKDSYNYDIGYYGLL